MRRRLAAVALSVVVAAGACGGGGEQEVAAPEPVPDGLVPAMVQQERFGFYETGVEGARKAFAEAGPDSLAADGRLWELRTGERLIGVLQLTTLLPEIDVRNPDHRDPIVRQLLPTARDRFDLGDITIWSTTTAGKTTYLWFGDGMFSLLTVKPGSEDEVDTEGVLQDVLDHMVAQPGWEYVYFDDEEGEEA